MWLEKVTICWKYEKKYFYPANALKYNNNNQKHIYSQVLHNRSNPAPQSRLSDPRDSFAPLYMGFK